MGLSFNKPYGLFNPILPALPSRASLQRRAYGRAALREPPSRGGQEGEGNLLAATGVYYVGGR